MPIAIINVSNRLPVTISQGTVTKSSGGLVAALEAFGDSRYALRWTGWPGTSVDDPAQQAELSRALDAECRCSPVFLTQQEVEGFYEGFSNSSLWPMLHYMTTYMRYEPAWWDQYRSVNRRFADKVLELAREDDLVWIHDYQLMLLPRMLRERMPSLRIGFFLHTPFPSYEVFRCHPRREELLVGMLGADQIGFHTFGYMRHFRSAVLRLLGIDSEFTRVRHAGRNSYLGVYPIGINAARFDQELNSPGHREKVDAFAAQFRGQQVVLSVERLDYTKGILHRLDAIDLFLRDCQDRDRIKFIFVAVPSRENVEQYQSLRQEVELRIGRINGNYATLVNSPIHFVHGSIDFTELCALYSLADVAVVAPLIDGMNLVAKEYVACQRDDAGVLILSEFAGAAVELFSAMIVNPYDGQAVANAIAQALAMPPQEKQQRMRAMRHRVMKYDAQVWARSFIEDLTSRSTMIEEPGDTSDACRRITDAIASGQRVAFFLDYDGTLREFESEPQTARPTAAISAVLDRLADLPNLDVTIVSGRTPMDLEAFLGHYPFGLVAEHGASIRRPGSAEWEDLDRNVSFAWKDELLKILRLYEQSTPGSFIEDKRTSLVWHYRRADPEFGQWKANELVTELASVTANDPVQVRHGNKIVEIVASQINKGAAVARLVEQQSEKYGLVVVAGDDTTDESMFRAQLPNLLSLKVGEGDTHAQFRLSNPATFRAFLRRCADEGSGKL